ncbi:unnamed protein product [Didymodactylos carnosus]|uniref:Uncharacterized protein n=1 Tax=Didymodactylos carnosus TaxID=1234261 RepID=A0A814GWT6_9BILA|nr:unnamed protein product [Didymodactylos carnosus]CAF1177509.1 unnamed protein product [Didymodactylos carnosus]CAF3773847.1 unnamed protein product [Didymodactylos carnosus]CAF3988744.1 unnamed protein product [Didymodactylos carnosus]
MHGENRQLAICGGLLGLCGFIMALIAIRIPYWTVIHSHSSTTTPNITSYGLFKQCNLEKCTTRSSKHFSPIILSILATFTLLLGSFLTCLLGFYSFSRRHFYLAPICLFISCFLFLGCLSIYGKESLLNSHSSKLIVATLAFVFKALYLASYISGRYSILYKQHQQDFEKNCQHGDGGL